MRETEGAERHKLHDIDIEGRSIVCRDCNVTVVELQTEITDEDDVLNRIERLLPLRGIPGLLKIQEEYIKREYACITDTSQEGKLGFIVMILGELDEKWCRVMTLREKEYGTILAFLEEYGGYMVYHKSNKGDKVGISLEHIDKRYHIKERSILKESRYHVVCNRNGEREKKSKEDLEIELLLRGIRKSELNTKDYRRYQTMRYIVGEYRGIECKLGKEIGDKVEVENKDGRIELVRKENIRNIRIKGV